MINKKWFVFSVVLVVNICNSAVAREKRIRLEDIEQDNLKNEAELMTRGQYLKPPSINAEQTANYGPPDDDFEKKHYAVEEDTSTEMPMTAFASNAVFLTVDQSKDLAQQATNSPHGPLQATYLGYVPAMAMHLVYIPQSTLAGKSGVKSAYHKNIPAIVYQPVMSPSYIPVKPKISYQSDKGYHKAASSSSYVQVPETDLQQSTGYDQSNYVIVPQTYEQEQPQSSYGKYLDRQQDSYKYTEPQQSAYEKYSAPQYKYSTYANQQQYVLDNTITQDELFSQTDNSPSAPYKTITPKYIAPQQITKISPPPAAFHTPTSDKAGDTPRVLSEHAHGKSNPVYSHISGNLVQDSYKSEIPLNYKGYSSYYYAPGNTIQQSTYYGNYKPKSLLDSYIPSSLQVEYLKRGLSKEPLATYDIIANSRNFRLEGGFLPNQLYTTGNGGVVFDQFKRSTKEAV